MAKFEVKLIQVGEYGLKDSVTVTLGAWSEVGRLVSIVSNDTSIELDIKVLNVPDSGADDLQIHDKGNNADSE